MKYEIDNPNLYLAKSVVDIYNFKPRQLERNIQMASELNNKDNLDATIKTIKLISDVMNLKIRNLIKI